jgi:hypothetical protein
MIFPLCDGALIAREGLGGKSYIRISLCRCSGSQRFEGGCWEIGSEFEVSFLE